MESNAVDEEMEKSESEGTGEQKIEKTLTDTDIEKFTVQLMNATLLESNVGTEAERSLESNDLGSYISMLTLVMCNYNKTPTEIRRFAANRFKNMLFDDNGLVKRGVWGSISIPKRAEVICAVIIATEIPNALEGDGKENLNKLLRVDLHDIIYMIRHLDDVKGNLKSIGWSEVAKVNNVHYVLVDKVMTLLEVDGENMENFLPIIWEAIYHSDDVSQLLKIFERVGLILGEANDLLCNVIKKMLGEIQLSKGEKQHDEMLACWARYDMPKTTLLAAFLVRVLKMPVREYSEFVEQLVVRIGKNDIKSRIWARIYLPELLLHMASSEKETYIRSNVLKTLTGVLAGIGNSEIVASSEDFFRIVLDIFKADEDSALRFSAIQCLNKYLLLHKSPIDILIPCAEAAEVLSSLSGEDSDSGSLWHDCQESIQQKISQAISMTHLANEV